MGSHPLRSRPPRRWPRKPANPGVCPPTNSPRLADYRQHRHQFPAHRRRRHCHLCPHRSAAALLRDLVDPGAGKPRPSRRRSGPALGTPAQSRRQFAGKDSFSCHLIAVFNHSSQRAPYLRLTSLIDGTNNQARYSRKAVAIAPNGMVGVASTPTFFSRNLGSLSDAFANLQSERVVERIIDSNLRQSVTYIWETQ